jgi:hypothetical protein
VIGFFLLKHIYGLSDEGVCERWVYDPYFQHFTGEEFFPHEFPHERSDLSHWRKRLGGKLEILLAESLRVAHESEALRTKDLARVTVDTTVQPKDITFPTDAKLLHAAVKGLTRLARKRGVRLRQSYVRIAKRAAMMAGRYAHAKQFNRHRRQLRILRTRLAEMALCFHMSDYRLDGGAEPLIPSAGFQCLGIIEIGAGLAAKQEAYTLAQRPDDLSCVVDALRKGAALRIGAVGTQGIVEGSVRVKLLRRRRHCDQQSAPTVAPWPAARSARFRVRRCARSPDTPLRAVGTLRRSC